MWRLGMRSGGGLVSSRLAVVLDDLKGLFQPELFYDSVPSALPVCNAFASSFSLLC